MVDILIIPHFILIACLRRNPWQQLGCLIHTVKDKVHVLTVATWMKQ
jgi:hypothetical protein